MSADSPPAAPAEPPPATPLALVVGDLALPRGEGWPEGAVEARPTDPGDALDRIESEKALSDELRADIRKAIDGFHKVFVST